MRNKAGRKAGALLIVMFMLLSFMAACGEADAPETTTATTTTAATTTRAATTTAATTTAATTTAAPEPVEIDVSGEHFTIMSTYDHPEAFLTFYGTNDPNAYSYWPSVQAQCLTWQAAVEKYGFTVETIIVPNTELVERLIAGEMAGQPVADLWTYHTGWYALGNPLTLIKEGYMTPLDDYVDLDYLAFNPDYRPMYMFQGQTFGVAYRDSYLPPQMVTFANRMLIEDAGLDPKEIQDESLRGNFTWEKMQEIAEQIARDTTEDGINDIMGFGILPADIEKFALSNNASPIRQDGDKFVSGLLDREYLAAMDFLYNNAVAEVADLTGNSYTMFGENRLGFIMAGIMHATNQDWIGKLGEDMMLLPLPKGPNATDYVNILGMGVHAWYMPSSVAEERKPIIGRFLEIYLNAYSSNLGEDPHGDHERAVANYQRTGIWMTWSSRTVDDTRVFHYLDTLPRVNEFFLVMPGFNEVILPTREDISTLVETPTVTLNRINDLWQSALDDFYGQ